MLAANWTDRLADDPEFGRDRQEPVSPTEGDDMAGILALGELAGDEAIAQTSNFVLVQVAQRVAQLLWRGLGSGNQTMPGQAVEHPFVIRVHQNPTFTLH